ncbi:patatin-like phospholipase family protein [Flavivirga aquimarina]|uniref:Patatin-like phospholipase family protein n=1 Tax=Flavivirga aquimarina TaxID=2027862 RepID=A0ABT8WBZ9_9FLAO|nr:patatin-like phospholipase family protein [Flavivirga aquimarina]MDO5970675.1 patatin-like phospholipase family protein [Flavivirga aquimarina]
MKYVLTLILIFICFEGSSQEPKNDDVKIGLVLSGGGAKGLAHVGVLKIIDSLGLKVDYVAGTSMGAIVGALYASGYSGNQLDSIFKNVNFDNIINDNLPRASKAFYERDNNEKYAVKLPFNDFKIKLPSALSRGQNAYNLLSKLTLHVNEIKNFSELPIPFFCIATDIETGEAVMLEKGNLAQSAIASGALPSIFQPVVINDQMLTDGGVVNNYPIDELKAKGMDVIIGIDVQDGLVNREKLASAPEVLFQINNFRTIKSMKLKAPKTDIYIKPDVKEFNVVSFSEVVKIIENGKQAAINKLEDLQALIKTNVKEEVKPKIKIQPQDSIIINSLSISGRNSYTRSYILGKLKLKLNKKISYKDFNEGVNNLVATNNFDAFQYEFKKTKEKEGYDLFATLTETENTLFLKAGIHYDDLYKSALLVNVTKNHFLFNNDVASLDIILGDNVRYNFEYFIDKGFYWSIGLKSRYQQFNKNINAKLLLDDDDATVIGLNKIDVELQDQTNQFYLQTLFRKDFALSLGAEHKRWEIKSETILSIDSDEGFIFENTDYFSVFGSLKLDTYDDKYFPTKGFYFNGDMHLYLYASRFNENFDRFSIAKADIGYAFSFSDKLAFNLQTSTGFKLGDKSTQSLDFTFGGYGNNLINNSVPFLGYDFLSFTGNSYIKASASVDYNIFKHHHITLEGNWANVDDDIFETGEWFSFSDYNGYALGYAIDTFVGPIQGKFSYSPEQKKSVWFFNIGFWF